MPNIPDRLTDEQIARLREGLERKRWRQTDLAREIDVRDSTVSAILSGKQGPQSSTLASMCAALDLNLGYVVLGNLPKWTDGSESKTGLRPVAVSLGIDRWLIDTPEGRSTTPEEVAELRACQWFEPYIRYPDAVYAAALASIRDARAFAASGGSTGQNGTR